MLLLVDKIDMELVEKHLYQVLNADTNDRLSPEAIFAAPV